VQLVIQGGLGTLDTCIASAELGSPLLILADSGGAATAIAQFCTGGESGGGVRVHAECLVDCISECMLMASLSAC